MIWRAQDVLSAGVGAYDLRRIKAARVFIAVHHMNWNYHFQLGIWLPSWLP